MNNTVIWGLVLTASATTLISCAPGKKSAGIGCSKTSSVLKTPVIVKADSETSFDPNNKATPEEQRSLFYKHFGQFKAQTTGGYVYIQSRAANDVMGAVPANAPWYRCSVLLEFPKLTGEIRAPSINTSPWYGKTAAQIEADRFPARADPLKVRIYSAAHCFDYSINERVVLSPFSVVGQDLPSFKEAYANIDVSVPELVAIQNLRKALSEKVTAGSITNQNAIDILKAFQPATRNMRDIFGLPADGTIPNTPSAKQSCMIPPNDTGNAKQYTCATYHDMVVLDVELSNLTAAQDTMLRDLRERSIIQSKKIENEGPDANSSTSMTGPSPWTVYATDSGFRMFTSHMINETCEDYMPPPPPTCTPNFSGGFPVLDSFGQPTQTCSPTTDIEPAPTAPSCTSNLFPAMPENVVAGNPNSEYPKIYTIKLSCKGVAAPECDEVPINTIQNLHYMRYMTRERLRTFSRYNIVGSLPSMPADLLSCGSSTTGICAAKDNVQTALSAVANNLTLTSSSLSAANFNSNTSPYGKAENQVDGALEVWKDFFAASDDPDLSNTSSNVTLGTGSSGTFITTASQSSFFKKQLNPINFLDLNSNFIVQDRAETTLPEPTDMMLRRAFLTLPINNIIGLNEFTSFTMDDPFSNPRPIYIDSWASADGSGKGGRFLRFWTTKNQLNTFLDSFTSNGSFGDHFNPADPNSYFVILDKSTVNPLTDFIAPIPTQATLQKGDSGSIFTLDGIPMFALSTVNGEPTSGGAALAAIPVAGADSDDTLPGGPEVASGGAGGGAVAAAGGTVCK